MVLCQFKSKLLKLSSTRCRAYSAASAQMYFGLWKPSEVTERMWIVNLAASMSGENQTIGGHSGQPAEQLRALMTGAGVPWE